MQEVSGSIPLTSTKIISFSQFSHELGNQKNQRISLASTQRGSEFLRLFRNWEMTTPVPSLYVVIDQWGLSIVD
jgi:hypothetical protein